MTAVMLSETREILLQLTYLYRQDSVQGIEPYNHSWSRYTDTVFFFGFFGVRKCSKICFVLSQSGNAVKYLEGNRV